jgi:hypothetical protein
MCVRIVWRVWRVPHVEAVGVPSQSQAMGGVRRPESLLLQLGES